MNEGVEAMDVIAICRPKYKDRPQIARVIQKTRAGYSIHWMTGTYSGPWAVAKKRDGRKKVPWVDTIKESDIIYKKISLTSGHKLTNKVAQTLRALYAAKEGNWNLSDREPLHSPSLCGSNMLLAERKTKTSWDLRTCRKCCKHWSVFEYRHV